MSDTEARSNGPTTAMRGEAGKPSCRPISSTVLPAILAMHLRGGGEIPAACTRSWNAEPTRTTVFPATAALPLVATWMPTREQRLLLTGDRGDVEDLVVLDRHPSACPLPSIAIPAPTVVSTFCLTMEVLTDVAGRDTRARLSATRLPVIRTWPGWTVSVPASTTMPSVPCPRRGG